MIKVGITGGIGSGKTTVCRIFESIGIPVYYADVEAKRLMYRNKALKSAIKDVLGDEAYHRNGRLNRSFVASKIFSNPTLMTQINGLVHPAVGEDALRWFAELDASIPYALKEAALLVENGSYKQLDYLISVTALEGTRIKRVMKRDQISKTQILKRMKNQLPQGDKDKVADFIIDNNGQHSLVQQVWAIDKKLRNL